MATALSVESAVILIRWRAGCQGLSNKKPRVFGAEVSHLEIAFAVALELLIYLDQNQRNNQQLTHHQF